MSGVNTMNLAMSDEGMVALDNPYIPPPNSPNSNPPMTETLMPPKDEEKLRKLMPPMGANSIEKNVENKQMTMDSTPISDLVESYNSGSAVGLSEPPAPSADPRMQSLTMTAPQPPASMVPQPAEQPKPVAENKNPFNLTDDQMEALLVGVCAAIAISKPVQEKLASSVPRFMNDMGGRSAVGLASTGLVAAIVYFIIQRYVFKK